MKTMRSLSLAVLYLISAFCVSQESPGKPRGDRFAAGFNLSQSGRDFGIGINLTSPYIKGITAFRLSENYQWLEYVDTAAVTQWRGYHNIKFGVLSTGVLIQEQIRLYGEGGVSFIILDNSFSSQTLRIGGYGVFGFEFLMDKLDDAFMSYFIELGGIGTGAVADKLPAKPIISNGFLISTGLRVYF